MPSIILWVGGGLILILLVIGVAVTFSSERDLVEERIETFMNINEAGLEFGVSEEIEEEKTSFLADSLSRLVSGTSFSDRISAELAKADLKLKVGEYVFVLLGSIIGTGLVGFFIFGGGFSGGTIGIVFLLVGLFIGYFIPMMIIKRQQKKRLKKFGDQLPEMINLMVNGLRAGYSTMQAMEAISKEMPAPINTEFRRVVQEMQLGISMTRALDNLLRRIPSPDLDLMVTAINVQREVGGNLAEILEIISHTIRERIRIKGEIIAITAQVSYSGRFLSALPLILSTVLWLINRDYMMQFFLEPIACGVGMLSCGAINIVIGYFAMERIADIEI